MRTASISSADLQAFTQAASKLNAAKVSTARGAREEARALLNDVRALLPAPAIEPAQRTRLAADFLLAQLELEAGHLTGARDHANQYLAQVRAWFPTDTISSQQAEELLRKIDARDPCD